MAENLKLLCIFAHPDDETLSTGSLLAKYAAEGVETYLICATRGEIGWGHPTESYPGIEKTGIFREAELRCAAQALGIKEVIFLDYIDGALDSVPAGEAACKIANHLRRVRPQVVITMDPQGVYCHPDHIALTQYTLAGIVLAAAADPTGAELPHTVSKVYMVAETDATLPGYAASYSGLQLRSNVDGIERIPFTWPGWEISAEIDTTAYWDPFLAALACHKSQIRDLDVYASMPAKFPPQVWGIRTFIRIYSLVNGGRAKETDLFEGLRGQVI